MTQLTIVTTPTNSGDGTPLATAFNYCNSNFSELYSRVQTSPPTTLVGSIGDFAGMYAYDSTYFYYCFADYDGSTIIWGQVTQVGNISISAINNGTSNIKIADVNGNATTSVNGTSNVVVVSSTGQYIAGVVSATGNITGNYILGNGSQLTGLPQSYSNANVAAYLTTYTGNISGGNLNIDTAITTPGTISAVGNITTSGFFLGDFIGNIVANITNIPGPGGAVVFNDGSGNATATAGLVFNNSGPNVLTVDGSYSATGNITAVGNIAGGNLSGTNIAGTLTTAAQNNITSVGTLSSLAVTGNVAGGNITTAGQVSATGNIRTAGYLFVTQDVNVGGDVTSTSYTGTTVSMLGNVTGGNILTGGLVSATGNVTGGNLVTSGLVTTTANITGGNILTSGLISAAGNIRVGNLVTSGNITADSTISAGGNVTGGNVLTGGAVSAAGNVTGGAILTGGLISATGNITGGNILFGSGQVSGTGNITASNLYSGGEISAVGTITGQQLTVTTGNVTCGNIINSNANGVGNIGSATTYFDTVFATATSAQYADLAEIYLPDVDYAPGTVVIFGGEKEITVSTEPADERVAGVISTEPAHLMNAGQSGLPVALRGRVPVNVVGPVTKGDSLVTSATAGFAQSVGRDRSYGQAVFAKALETNIDSGEKVIIAVII